MTVMNDLLNLPRPIEVQNNRDNWSCYFDTWVDLKRKGKKDFKKALGLEWWFCGSEVAIVKCDTRTEAENLAMLFDSIQGKCTDEEWDAWFDIPED